jgi:hypothetical protein
MVIETLTPKVRNWTFVNTIVSWFLTRGVNLDDVKIVGPPLNMSKVAK